MAWFRRMTPKSYVAHNHITCSKAVKFIEAGNYIETEKRPNSCTHADCCQAIDRQIKRDLRAAVKAIPKQ